jgi:hypothetical protein
MRLTRRTGNAIAAVITAGVLVTALTACSSEQSASSDSSMSTTHSSGMHMTAAPAKNATAAAAKALDANSVAISNAIASVYGAKAGQTFLNGKFMYTVTFGDFLAGATGLPKVAVRNDLLGHVLELKNQLDAYAAGDYTKAADAYDAAYDHMFMTGDLIAGAIAKQKNL